MASSGAASAGGEGPYARAIRLHGGRGDDIDSIVAGVVGRFLTPMRVFVLSSYTENGCPCCSGGDSLEGVFTTMRAAKVALRKQAEGSSWTSDIYREAWDATSSILICASEGEADCSCATCKAYAHDVVALKRAEPGAELKFDFEARNGEGKGSPWAIEWIESWSETKGKLTMATDDDRDGCGGGNFVLRISSTELRGE